MAIDSKYGKVTLEKGTIGEDEPVFVLRAKDRLSPALLQQYILLCLETRTPRQRENGATRRLISWGDPGVPMTAVARLHRDLSRFIEWQDVNPTQTPNIGEDPA